MIYGWYLLLRDWLECLAHVDLGHEHAEQVVTGRSAVETAWWVATTRLRGERGYSLVNPPITVQLADTPHVQRKDWQRAIREANAGHLPTDPHLLLRDARGAFNRRLFRRCVLDAATAAELVASPLLARRLDNSLGPSARKKLVQDQTPMSRKIAALKALGISLPQQLQRDLFNLRTKVIHEGKSPAIGEARRALEVAFAVVTLHAPL